MSIHYLNEITSDRDRGTWRIIAKITHMWRIIGEKNNQSWFNGCKVRLNIINCFYKLFIKVINNKYEDSNIVFMIIN